MMSTMSLQKTPVQHAEHDFEREIRAVVERVQGSIRAIIEATPGITRRPTDLRNTLGINAKVAWQVHRVAHADDPCAEVAHLPRPVAMERFLKAAAKRGAPAASMAAVRQAFATYEDLARHHAGGRVEFESLVSNLARTGTEHIDLQHRRAACRAQSHFLGIQAETHVACYVVSPGRSDDSMLDMVALRGMVGLQRYRRDVGWVISSMRATKEGGALQPNTGPELLAPESDPSGVGLLRRFCSDPLPQIRQVPGRNGAIDVELQPDGLGASSAITCIVGHVFRNAMSRYAAVDDRYLKGQVRVRTPCKVLVQDMMMHRDLVLDAPPKGMVFSDHRDVDPVSTGRERDLIFSGEAVTHLGRGVEVLATPEVPRYEEMVRFAIDQLGWRSSDFDVFRHWIEYPIMPASVVVQFELEEAPKGERT